MTGVPIDLSYLAEPIRKWKPTEDPLQDAAGIALKYSNRLVRLLRADDLQELRHLVKSAIPWIHLKNFHPAAEVQGDTPEDLIPKLGDRRWWLSAYATLSLIAAMDLRVVSYTCENDGWVFTHLTAKPGSGSLHENSLYKMVGHTDALHFPFPNEFKESDNLPPPAPDFVVLAGIRNPDGVNTRVARLSKLLETISSEAQDQLRLPIFIFGRQETYTTAFEKLVGYPVLSQHHAYGDFIRFSSSRVVVEPEKYPEAEKALNELTLALKECREPVNVAPGDVLLINNRTALHGRDEITKEEYGGQTRWLMRTYGYRLDTPGRFKDPSKPHLLSCEK